MTMLERILELPDQLRWGAELSVAGVPSRPATVVLGMGGSGMAGAAGALEASRAGALVSPWRTYGLPPWAGPGQALVVAVSYSGNTEETLSGVEEALELGLPVVAVTSGGELAQVTEAAGHPVVRVPGGLQPRAAIGYLTGGVAAVLHAAGRVPPAATALTEAATVVEELLGGGGGVAVELAADLAEAAAGRIPVVYGGVPVGSLAAYRWKTQVNENAKAPAWSAEVPESNHNELEGWEEPGEPAAATGVVVLRDRLDHPRIARRLELMTEIVGSSTALLGTVVSTGESALARFFSLAVVGDLFSVELARRRGVEATPVALLEDFKKRMRKETP